MRSVDHYWLVSGRSFRNFADEFQVLQQAGEARFRFCFTVAATTALLMKAGGADEEDDEDLLSDVTDGLRRRWGPEGEEAVLDCSEFVKGGMQGLEGIDALAYSIGLWAVWNILDQEPGEEHTHLATVVGRMAVTVGTETDYWTEEQRTGLRALVPVPNVVAGVMIGLVNETLAIVIIAAFIWGAIFALLISGASSHQVRRIEFFTAFLTAAFAGAVVFGLRAVL